MLKNKTQLKFVRKSFFAILYGLMSAIGINVFLSHAHSYSIGVPGIAQLLQAIFANFGISVSISFLMIIMNIPLFLFALKAFGFNYIVFSLMAVASNIFFLRRHQRFDQHACRCRNHRCRHRLLFQQRFFDRRNGRHRHLLPKQV